MPGVARYAALLLAALVLATCAHTTNLALCEPDSSGPGRSSCSWSRDGGYRFDPQKADRKTLIVLTFSGGGIRAAALAYGALLALDELNGISGEGRLLDEVDIISSVSGGSVTAGWYALKGKDGLSPDEQHNAMLRFLHAGGMGALAWRGLNPVALGSYLFTPYQRSDVLADFFADRLYGKATYRDVEARYRQAGQPFVILNATDLGHETRFSFTQGRFDLICSDLARYRLADAVAASANFPIVFSPMGLRNYSDDCPARGAEWMAYGAPQWIERYDRFDSPAPVGTNAPKPPSNGLLQLRAARDARDYLDPGADDRYLHLVDGGLVDNLGIQATFAIEDDPVCAPGLFQRLAVPRPTAYERYDAILYVVVNARTRSPAGIDGSEYPPDVLSSLYRVIDTPLDSTILGMQNYLTSELQAIQHWVPSPGYRPTQLSPRGTCWRQVTTERSAGLPPSRAAQDPNTSVGADRSFKFQVISIDFEMIPNEACRRKYWQLGTNWTLDHQVIDGLMLLPKVLLRRSDELKDFYRDAGRRDRYLIPASFPSDFGEVCGDVSTN